MLGFEDVNEALVDGEWSDAHAVITAVRARLSQRRPAHLAAVRVGWSEPYLSLTLTHDDGTVLEISDGDGYTAITTGAEVDFHGYLASADLIAVVLAALTDGALYVRRTRAGIKVADYFQLADRGGEALGLGSYGIAGFPGTLLGKLPRVRESECRICIHFERAAALTPMVRGDAR